MSQERWTPDAIREQLETNVSKGLSPSANVFIDANVENTDLGEIVRGAIDGAAFRLKRTPDVKIGKLRKLAKSASVTGDPDVIAEMLNEPSVTAILPSAVDDVYPKPVNVKYID